MFVIVVISADGTNSRTYSVAATFVQPDSMFAQWQALNFEGDATNPLIAGASAMKLRPSAAVCAASSRRDFRSAWPSSSRGWAPERRVGRRS